MAGIHEEVTAMRDGMQAVHDPTAELMNSGADIHTTMREVKVPEHLDIGEGYGKTPPGMCGPSGGRLGSPSRSTN